MDEDKKVEATLEVTAESILAAKDTEIAKLTEERDNYKNVALKRLGKLPKDADFVGEADESGLTVEERVKQTLIEDRIAAATRDKEAEVTRIAKENAELRLALKNRPSPSIGGDSNSGTEVKDNVLTDTQIAAMTARAKTLRLDPEKYIARAKENLQKNR